MDSSCHVRVHPIVIQFAKRREAEAACGPTVQVGGEACEAEVSAAGFEIGLGGAFGVRRPLRFLAQKLALDDAQVAELATILDGLKTERAQAAVDDRRALALFAEAVAGDGFDRSRAGAGADLRRQSAEKLASTVVDALGRIHALLKPEQRRELAYMIRTGTLLL
ncbi:MAG TPA: Spy/CpxP family protein refolding chaperone [Candidatus Polarisedimenticolaceae bacterium]|nr:Spy/CpxP family protein refolding chaperone [Candidatus Polarisedimenticolaceae bacterium]